VKPREENSRPSRCRDKRAKENPETSRCSAEKCRQKRSIWYLRQCRQNAGENRDLVNRQEETPEREKEVSLPEIEREKVQVERAGIPEEIPPEN